MRHRLALLAASSPIAFDTWSVLTNNFVVENAGFTGREIGVPQALREGEVDRFRSRKLDELEQWLADRGYTDDQERLTGEDRLRLTLQRAAPATTAEAADVNRVVSWLEANDAARDRADDQAGGSGDGFGIERRPD